MRFHRRFSHFPTFTPSHFHEVRLSTPMSDFKTVRRRILTASMLLSILLHGAAFLFFGMWSFEGEVRVYRVLFRPAGPIRARRFRVIAPGRSRPEVTMERLLARAEPEMRSMPGSVPIRGEVRLPEPPAREERLPAIARAKPSEFLIPSTERISTEELGAPKRARFDPTLDLLRWEDLERAGFKSFVVVDPGDRRNLVGFFHIARTQGSEGMDLTRLAETLSRRTKLRVRAEDHSVSLRSPELLGAPLLFMGRPGSVQYDDSGTRRASLGVGVDTLKVVEGVEKQDIAFLAAYLLKGGFLILPNLELYDQLQRHLREAHPDRFTFFDLPDDHELFHSYYDIAPRGLYALFRSVNLRNPTPGRSLPSVFRGIGSQGRLVAFAAMEVPSMGATPDSSVSALYRPMTRLATNLIAFALTQPGGIGYTAFKESRPERSYEGEPNAALAVLRSGRAEALDPARATVFLSGERLSKGEESDEGSAYDGMLFHPLTGGKRTVRIEHEGKTAERTVVLRGDRVTTLTIGSTRFLWMTKLWAEVSGEDESVPAWRARTAHLKIRDVE